MYKQVYECFGAGRTLCLHHIDVAASSGMEVWIRERIRNGAVSSVQWGADYSLYSHFYYLFAQEKPRVSSDTRGPALLYLPAERPFAEALAARGLRSGVCHRTYIRHSKEYAIKKTPD